MQTIPVAAIAPDLRFALAEVWADGLFALIGDVEMNVTGYLPATRAIPAYLHYGDRDAELVVLGIDGPVSVAQKLGELIAMLGEAESPDDLSLAVAVLDAVDCCFREAGLWRGNIYLAGAGALSNVLGICGIDAGGRREPLAMMRELAALELAYLFPVAGKFRSGRYDGEVQYRLNGWGRALATRLAAGLAGQARAHGLREAIRRHLAAERGRYESFLRGLGAGRQDYDGDLLEAALGLPIPVLV